MDRTERERELEQIVVDTMWMARRYACGHHTYAPSIINECLDKLDKLGIVITDDMTLMEDGNSNARKLDVS